MPEFKRIIELDPTSVIPADAELPVDSPSIGSRKISWPDLLDLILAEADEAVAAAGTFAATAGEKAAEAQQSADDAADEKTAAETARTGAETAQGVATAQAAISTTQAGIATLKAGEAAASAITALNAIADKFKGGVAGNSIPNTLPLAGDYYEITAAGTSQGKTWGVGDKAIYNGTSGSWTQLEGYFNGHQALVDPVANSRAAVQGIQTFGGINVSDRPLPVELSATTRFSVFAWIYRPAGTTGQGAIWGAADVGGPSLIINGDTLGVQTLGAGIYNGPILREGWSLVGFIFDGDDYFFVLDGVISAGGVNASLTRGLQYIGGAAYNNTLIQAGVKISQPLYFDYALSAAQVARLFDTASVDPVDIHPNGAGTQLLTGDNSNFAGGIGNWVGINGGTASASGGKLVISTLGHVYDGVALNNIATWMVKGFRYRLTVTVDSLTGGGTHICSGDGTGFIFTNHPVGTSSIELNAPATSQLALFQRDGGATGGVVSLVKLECLGVEVALDSQWDGIGHYWPDISGKANHLLLGAGVQPMLKKVTSAQAVGQYTIDGIYGSRPLLSHQIAAGYSHTTGGVVAEVRTTGYGALHGLFMVQSTGGSRLYLAGGRVGKFSPTVTLIAAIGTFTEADAPVELDVVTDGLETVFQLKSMVTAAQTVSQPVYIIPIQAVIDIPLVK
jgi:hypothetical protein